MLAADRDTSTSEAARAESVRFGILGAARIARMFLDGVAGSEKLVVSHVASRDAERASAFARESGVAGSYGSYEALLADPQIEAVYNPLPNSLHAEWSIRACEAGKHVLCEKPLAVSAVEARAMFDAARVNGVLLFEAYPYLAQPQTVMLRRIVAAGEIGRLRMIHASFGFTISRLGDIRLDAGLGGGALLDVGSYPVSLVRALAGARPARVRAVGTTIGDGVNGTTLAILEHADGLLAQIGASFEMALHRSALVVGEAGYAETNYANHVTQERPAWLRVKRGQTGLALPEEIEVPLADGFRLEAESFADAIRLGAERWTGATPAESVDVALTLEAIAKSARTGQPVEL